MPLVVVSCTSTPDSHTTIQTFQKTVQVHVIDMECFNLIQTNDSASGRSWLVPFLSTALAHPNILFCILTPTPPPCRQVQEVLIEAASPDLPVELFRLVEREFHASLCRDALLCAACTYAKLERRSSEAESNHLYERNRGCRPHFFISKPRV